MPEFEGASASSPAEHFDTETEFPNLLALLGRYGAATFGPQTPDAGPYSRNVMVQKVLLDGHEIGELRFTKNSRVYAGLVPLDSVKAKMAVLRSRKQVLAPPEKINLLGTEWISLRLHYEFSQKSFKRGDGWSDIAFP